jgi:hypothetical protein
MSSKNKNLSVEKITKADLSVASVSTVPASVKLTSSAFDTMGGEVFSGLNILKLAEGEAAGPFRFLKTVQQTMPAKGKKPAEDVTCYVAEHLSFPGREIRLPISASLVKKCEDAKLTEGDIIAVRRSGDYVSKNFAGQKCQGFDLRVIARSTQTANLDKLALEYPPQN